MCARVNLESYDHSTKIHSSKAPECLEKLKINKSISILTETYFNLDQIHHITGWVSPFFSPAYSHTEGLLVLLLLGLEGDTEVDNDAKRRFVSFKVTLSNDRALYIYALSFRGLHLGTVG